MGTSNIGNLRAVDIEALRLFHQGEPVGGDRKADDIAAQIRALPAISIEDCVAIIRAASSKLKAMQKGRMTSGGTVICPVEIAVEQMDICSDLVEECGGMRSDSADQGTVEQMVAARRLA